VFAGTSGAQFPQVAPYINRKTEELEMKIKTKVRAGRDCGGGTGTGGVIFI